MFGCSLIFESKSFIWGKHFKYGVFGIIFLDKRKDLDAESLVLFSCIIVVFDFGE